MGANGGKHTVILNGTLIDGSGAEPTPNNAIVISGNRIRSVGQLPGDVNLEDKDNVTVIDAAGQWVIPGLIDCHAHLSSRQPAVHGIPWPGSAEHATLWAARNAQRDLHAGVTSLASPGGKWVADVTVRNAINAGLLEGPRISCAGRTMITVGSLPRNPTYNPLPEDDSTIFTPTPEAMAAEVRREVKNGVNFIKVHDSEYGHSQVFTREELAMIVDEAHRKGYQGWSALPRLGFHARWGPGGRRPASST